jgi:hypothetical protein
MPKPKRKTTPAEPPVVQGPPPPPAGVTKISPEDCFVIATHGYMLGVSRPDEFYYGGETEEGRAAAHAAAEAEVEWRKSLGHGLKYSVVDLDTHMSDMVSDAKQDGYQDGYTYGSDRSRD